MRASNPTPRPTTGRRNLLWDLLTFDRLLTGPVIHIIYWCGLGIVALSGFTVIGAAVGVAIRGGSLEGVLLAIPVLVGGVLAVTAMALLWRGACEFYLAVLNIAEDLKVLRAHAERDAAPRQVGRASPDA